MALAMERYAVCGEEIAKFRVRRAIGNHLLKLEQWGDDGGLFYAEFAVIGHQDLLLRHAYGSVLHSQFVEVKTGGAMLQA